MKREKQMVRFDWSRTPSREGIHSVYIANPTAHSSDSTYSKYGREITKEELSNALSTWNRITDLNTKKTLFKRLFFLTLASIPFISIIYNMVSTIIQNSN
jgi:hypothetical protein